MPLNVMSLSQPLPILRPVIVHCRKTALAGIKIKVEQLMTQPLHAFALSNLNLRTRDGADAEHI